MSQETEVIGVAELCERQPGDKENPVWINEDVKAVVRKCEPKQSSSGKKYWETIFADETSATATIRASLFAAPKFQQGDLVVISGNGRRLTEYNGKLEIGFSKGTTVHVLGRAAPVAAAPTPQRAATASVGEPEQLPGMSDGPGEAEPIHGATIGGAFGFVAEHILAARPELMPGSADWWRELYNHASDYVRIHRRLTAGHLAPPKREREAVGTTPPPRETPAPTPPPPTGHRMPPPGPDGSAFPPSGIPDEDVPF